MWSGLLNIAIFLIGQPFGFGEEYYGRPRGIWYPVMNNHGGTASLHTSSSNLGPSSHRCGASLISDRHLLTAASCMTEKESKRVVGIGLGRLNIDYHKMADMNSYKIDKVFIHPDFGSGREEYNDLAILVTDRKVKYSNSIYPYCLPESNQVLPSSTAVRIEGWGHVSQNQKTSKLQEGYKKLLDTPSCVSLWQKNALENYKYITRYKYPQGIDVRLLCTYRPAVFASIGDSGGPVSYQNRSGLHTVIGIIGKRTTIQPQNPNTPELFTNLSAYVDWIYATTGLPKDSLDKQCGGPPFLVSAMHG